MNKQTEIKTSTALKYILPVFVVFCFATIIPIIVAGGISLLYWRGGSQFKFIALKNYIDILQDKTFWVSFLHNLEFIGILMVTQIGFAFIIALFYQSKYVKMKEFHRRVIFAPAVLAPMVVGILWQLIYRTDVGFLAVFLRKIGLEHLIIPWLDKPSLVIPAICIALVWQYVGQFTIILTAGMQNVGKDLIEAAKIDGANAVQQATMIVFPLLKPTVFVCTTMCISGCMKMFDIIFSMSGGGPGNASMVTALYSYNLAFKSQKLGYASASAVCMVILSLVLVLASRKLLLGGESHDA